MSHQPRSLKRALALGLAACAIAPAAAGAMPVADGHSGPIGQAIAAGGGSGVTAKQFESQNLTAPDQVDRTVTSSTKANVYVPPTPAQASTPKTSPAPTWPTGPQPIATRHAPTTNASPKATPSNDGGLDTGVWVAIAGGALLALGAAGLAGQRLVVRKRQLA
jgi:hypothetical protein